MKKFILFFAISTILSGTTVCYGDDFDISGSNDLWEDMINSNIEVRDNQKAVSDEEFDKVIEQLKEKKEKKFRKKTVPKGEIFGNETDGEFIKEHSDNSAPVVCIPTDLRIGDSVLPVGHYAVEGEKIDGKTVLVLYQSGYRAAQIPAFETQDDFGEDTVVFARFITGEDEDSVKIIYGSMDFNAYAIIKIKEGIVTNY